MNLNEVVKQLNDFAPLSLAASWDNVGLLVEPSIPCVINRLMLTNDLLPKVFEEALARNVQMILSYHPPIFSPLKHLNQKSWKERLIVRCFENHIAVYSPHTCFDAVSGGVNDWLIKPFGGHVQVISQAVGVGNANSKSGTYHLECTVPCELIEQIQKHFLSLEDLAIVNENKIGVSSATRFILNCKESSLSKTIAFLNQFNEVSSTIELQQLSKIPLPGVGDGRWSILAQPITLLTAVNLVKQHVGLTHIRIAKAFNFASMDEPAIKTVAVCAGSGATVLRGFKASLYVTGEMSHHELLEATNNGINVILCEHSNSERGYLTQLKFQLEPLLKGVEIILSQMDVDPITIV